MPTAARQRGALAIKLAYNEIFGGASTAGDAEVDAPIAASGRTSRCRTSQVRATSPNAHASYGAWYAAGAEGRSPMSSSAAARNSTSSRTTDSGRMERRHACSPAKSTGYAERHHQRSLYATLATSQSPPHSQPSKGPTQQPSCSIAKPSPGGIECVKPGTSRARHAGCVSAVVAALAADAALPDLDAQALALLESIMSPAAIGSAAPSPPPTASKEVRQEPMPVQQPVPVPAQQLSPTPHASHASQRPFQPEAQQPSQPAAAPAPITQQLRHAESPPAAAVRRPPLPPPSASLLPATHLRTPSHGSVTVFHAHGASPTRRRRSYSMYQAGPSGTNESNLAVHEPGSAPAPQPEGSVSGDVHRGAGRLAAVFEPSKLVAAINGAVVDVRGSMGGTSRLRLNSSEMPVDMYQAANTAAAAAVAFAGPGAGTSAIVRRMGSRSSRGSRAGVRPSLSSRSLRTADGEPGRRPATYAEMQGSGIAKAPTCSDLQGGSRLPSQACMGPSVSLGTDSPGGTTEASEHDDGSRPTIDGAVSVIIPLNTLPEEPALTTRESQPPLEATSGTSIQQAGGPAPSAHSRVPAQPPTKVLLKPQQQQPQAKAVPRRRGLLGLLACFGCGESAGVLARGEESALVMQPSPDQQPHMHLSRQPTPQPQGHPQMDGACAAPLSTEQQSQKMGPRVCTQPPEVKAEAGSGGILQQIQSQATQETQVSAPSAPSSGSQHARLSPRSQVLGACSTAANGGSSTLQGLGAQQQLRALAAGFHSRHSTPRSPALVATGVPLSIRTAALLSYASQAKQRRPGSPDHSHEYRRAGASAGAAASSTAPVAPSSPLAISSSSAEPAISFGGRTHVARFQEEIDCVVMRSADMPALATGHASQAATPAGRVTHRSKSAASRVHGGETEELASGAESPGSGRTRRSPVISPRGRGSTAARPMRRTTSGVHSGSGKPQPGTAPSPREVHPGTGGPSRPASGCPSADAPLTDAAPFPGPASASSSQEEAPSGAAAPRLAPPAASPLPSLLPRIRGSRKRTRPTHGTVSSSLAALDPKRLAALPLEDLLEQIQAALHADDVARGRMPRALPGASDKAISLDAPQPQASVEPVLNLATLSRSNRRRSAPGRRISSLPGRKRASGGGSAGMGATHTTLTKGRAVGPLAGRRRRRASRTSAAAASHSGAPAHVSPSASAHQPVWRHGGKAMAYPGLGIAGMHGAYCSPPSPHSSLEGYFVRQPPYKKPLLAPAALQSPAAAVATGGGSGAGQTPQLRSSTDAQASGSRTEASPSSPVRPAHSHSHVSPVAAKALSGSGAALLSSTFQHILEGDDLGPWEVSPTRSSACSHPLLVPGHDAVQSISKRASSAAITAQEGISSAAPAELPKPEPAPAFVTSQLDLSTLLLGSTLVAPKASSAGTGHASSKADKPVGSTLLAHTLPSLDEAVFAQLAELLYGSGSTHGHAAVAAVVSQVMPSGTPTASIRQGPLQFAEELQPLSPQIPAPLFDARNCFLSPQDTDVRPASKSARQQEYGLQAVSPMHPIPVFDLGSRFLTPPDTEVGPALQSKRAQRVAEVSGLPQQSAAMVDVNPLQPAPWTAAISLAELLSDAQGNKGSELAVVGPAASVSSDSEPFSHGSMWEQEVQSGQLHSQAAVQVSLQAATMSSTGDAERSGPVMLPLCAPQRNVGSSMRHSASAGDVSGGNQGTRVPEPLGPALAPAPHSEALATLPSTTGAGEPSNRSARRSKSARASGPSGLSSLLLGRFSPTRLSRMILLRSSISQRTAAAATTDGIQGASSPQLAEQTSAPLQHASDAVASPVWRASPYRPQDFAAQVAVPLQQSAAGQDGEVGGADILLCAGDVERRGSVHTGPGVISPVSSLTAGATVSAYLGGRVLVPSASKSRSACSGAVLYGSRHSSGAEAGRGEGAGQEGPFAEAWPQVGGLVDAAVAGTEVAVLMYDAALSPRSSAGAGGFGPLEPEL